MEDDDDFGVLAYGQNKSNLSNIFNAESYMDDNPSQSLMYSAPKQPKKSVTEEYKNMKLMHSIAVYAYKLNKNKEYSFMGKVGAAILGDNEQLMYLLYLYKKKGQRMSLCTIKSTFNFSVLVDNYANFTDDSKSVWSIKFDTEKDMIAFGKQITLAKVNSFGSAPSQLLVQDLITGSGPEAVSGDILDIVYTGWLYENMSFGKVFDSNTGSEKVFSVAIGKSHIMKGWHEGLKGCKLGSVRLLFIPPDLAYGEQGLEGVIPANSVLIFEMEIQKLTSASAEELPKTPGKMSGLQKPSVRHRATSHDDIRSRGASLSEQLTLSPHKDNELIHRVAKVGLATLPMQSTAQLSSDSDAEREDSKRNRQREPSGSKRTSSILQYEMEKQSPQITGNQIPTSPRKPSLKSLAKDSVSDTIAKYGEGERDQRTGTREKDGTYASPKHRFTEGNIRTDTQSNQEFTNESPRHRYIEGNIQKQIPMSQNGMMQSMTESDHVQPQLYSPQNQPSPMYPVMTASPHQSYHSSYHGLAYPAYHVPPMVNPLTPMLDSGHLVSFTEETRYNSEQIKSILSHCMVTREQVEKMNKMLEDITSQSNLEGNRKIRHLDALVLAQNIDQIISENVQLKQECEVRNAKIQEMNDRMYEVIVQNQQSSRNASSVLELQNEAVSVTLSELKQKVQQAEEEKSSLKAKLSDAVSNLYQKTEECVELQKEKDLLFEKLGILEQKLQVQEELSVLQEEKGSEDKNNDRQLIERQIELANEEKAQFLKEAQSAKEHLKEALDKQSQLKDQVTELTKNLSMAMEFEEKLQRALQWQSKYDKLRSNVVGMKDEYEKKVVMLTKELAKSREATKIPQEYSAEMKRAMNILYKSLQNQVKGSAIYNGEEVLEICLGVIRSVTMFMIEKNTENGSPVKEKVDFESSREEQTIGDHSNSNEASQPNQSDCKIEEMNARPSDLMEEPSAGLIDSVQVLDSNPVAENDSVVELEHTVIAPEPNNDQTVDSVEAESGNSSSDLQVQPTDTFSGSTSTSTIATNKSEHTWKIEPPPLFDNEEEDEDDWLK